MLVTAELNQRNLRLSIALAIGTGIAFLLLGFFSPVLWLGLFLIPAVFYFARRNTRRRSALMEASFSESGEETLLTYVAFYRALDSKQKQRFKNLVKIFLDEVTITGIRTDVDEATRMLVAASAVIPIFGFEDWEYSGLGEVLIYPNAFGENYQADGDPNDQNILRMVGVNHLSGVMILSKADLFAGFGNAGDKRNVGIHEFAHLVDKADGHVDGIPAGIPASTIEPWIRWVGEELKLKSSASHHINDYAYTNEAEYFAVLTEYFFEAPGVLEKKAPELYRMLEAMYRQNTKRFLSTSKRRKRVGRNTPCPCGSGLKYKRCCRRA